MNNMLLNNAKIMIEDTCMALKALQIDDNICNASQIVAGAAKNNSTVITTGMGKAGHIAKKASSLLSSLGIPSFYIHPGEASHGDIGVFRPGDVLMVFSTSGKTREVIETVDLAKKLDVKKIIAITSHPATIVREKADVVIDMGIIKESGYLNIAPTTSIVVMLVISDIISTNASQLIGFTMKDYSIRHHGGYLGQKSRGEI